MFILITAFIALLSHVTLSSAVPANVLVARGLPLEGVRLHPANDTSKCLGIPAGSEVIVNGTAAVIAPCNGTPAQGWLVPADDGPIQIAGTNFCLDAGPPRGTSMPVSQPVKIQTCVPGDKQQTWYNLPGGLFEIKNQDPLNAWIEVDSCLAVAGDGVEVEIVGGCDASTPAQQWIAS